MDDLQNNVPDDNDIIDDSLSDSDDIGLEEVSDSEREEIESSGEDNATTPDYSSILSDINTNIADVYEYITGKEEEITLTDIHQDMRILTSLILLFFGYMIMRSLVFKMRRF